MDRKEDNSLSIAVYKPFNSNMYRLMNGNSNSSWLEIRLFYVRIAPVSAGAVPEHLRLRHLRRESGVLFEMNNVRVAASDVVVVNLRRDRVDRECSEVTYVSTDNVRVTGAVEFEVLEGEGEELVLCGSLERLELGWGNNGVGDSGNGGKTGWSMDCYGATGGNLGWMKGSSSIEVYIAGRCSGVPVILTKMIQVSPRRRASRHGMLDAIPEDEETEKENGLENGFIRQRKVPTNETEGDDYESDGKVEPRYYSEDMYYGEDGQLSWFNAGVRVGVGIGLGMCLGVGIGVGLLMRSYQATTRSFRRRFF